MHELMGGTWIALMEYLARHHRVTLTCHMTRDTNPGPNPLVITSFVLENSNQNTEGKSSHTFCMALTKLFNNIKFSFYHTMLHRVQHCHGKSSVCQSV